ncbi:hypothetical protein SAMN06272722_12629 [Paenibacillus sp. RU5A]|nr:hypothetical protein SAMN06272722_12629 [Paenibacillus sp. RU5A]SOC77537.1 hypothetical protein SAMN05880581_12629 [Paenibacillus sp. RU26A]SOC78472.1 hypothetical protein SAMN05880586_12629 [Paenibacillus sp. RU5M]
MKTQPCPETYTSSLQNKPRAPKGERGLFELNLELLHFFVQCIGMLRQLIGTFRDACNVIELFLRGRSNLFRGSRALFRHGCNTGDHYEEVFSL